jgi:hypothetical protein
VFVEIDKGDKAGNEEDPHVSPSLPKLERTRRDEEHSSKNEYSNQETNGQF